MNEHLNDGDQYKLIEMALKLFPKWYEVQDKGNSITIENYIPAANYGDFICFYKDCGTNRMHWFQFCVVHLIPKLGLDRGTILKGFFEYFKYESMVDYLYKHFKMTQNDY